MSSRSLGPSALGEFRRAVPGGPGVLVGTSARAVLDPVPLRLCGFAPFSALVYERCFLHRKRQWRAGAILALLVGSTTPAAGQRVLRPGACTSVAQPGDQWTDFSHVGLKLTLRLPAELRQLAQESLRGVARRARSRSIPSTLTPSVELVLGWEAHGKIASPLRQVLIFSTRSDSLPEGRPCALSIAGQPGRVFKTALMSEQHAETEYWIEAYWPGFVLAAVGPSLDAYEAVFAILHSISLAPEG